MTFDETPWRERGAFVSAGAGADRFLGLLPTHAVGSSITAHVQGGLSAGRLHLESAWEVAYIVAPAQDHTGRVSVNRFCELAPPLLASAPIEMHVRPVAVALVSALSADDQAFWMDMLVKGFEALAQRRRVKTSGLATPPPGFDPRKS